MVEYPSPAVVYNTCMMSLLTFTLYGKNYPLHHTQATFTHSRYEPQASCMMSLLTFTLYGKNCPLHHTQATFTHSRYEPQASCMMSLLTFTLHRKNYPLHNTQATFTHSRYEPQASCMMSLLTFALYGKNYPLHHTHTHLCSINEGTKVQNPRCLCHVYNIYNVYIWIYTHTRTNAWVYGEVYGHLAKTKALSSSSLLPTLRAISGTSWPPLGFWTALETSVHGKSERTFAAVRPNATLVSEY